jgi:hypothetical protein
MSQRFNYSKPFASQLGNTAENTTITLSQKIDDARVITNTLPVQPEKEELCPLFLEISAMMDDFNGNGYNHDDFYSRGMHIK